jgi:ribonuclease R
VLVHIADVAAVVAADGPVDREARRRGFSVYLPGRVDPMLPQALSSGRCSLTPGTPRDVVTVELSVGSDRRVGRPSFSRAQIVSRRRLSYDEVEAVLAHGHRATRTCGRRSRTPMRWPATCARPEAGGARWP